MFEDFKAFIMRGNVIDLAVGIAIGASFTVVVGSLVSDIITPLTGIFGSVDFSAWTIMVGESELRPGLFLNAVIAFILLAAIVFFLIVRPLARMQRSKEEEEASDDTPTEVELLIEIRDELRRRSSSSSVATSSDS